MEHNALLDLLREFIREAKDASVINAREHKEINTCLTAVKLQIGTVEALCKNSENIRHGCFKTQEDIEGRVRAVEKLLPLEDLPEKFDALAIRVYKIMGASAVLTAFILLMAGVVFKQALPGVP